MTSASRSVAARLQSTLIAPGLTAADIEAHCTQCVEYGFNAAMIPARWVPVARAVLAGSGVLVASAADFPFGAMTTQGLVAEIQALVTSGVDQIDVGLPVGLLRGGEASVFAAHVAAAVAAAGPVPLKAMLELPLLAPSERDAAVDICVEAGIRYLKNASSGAVGVARPEDIAYLRGRAPGHVGIKASGGIKTLAHALALVDAGADLVGTGSAVAIAAGADPATGASGHPVRDAAPPY
ncbi:MAG TPA: deoxyribose-phosphate aldolase [Candidatus Dormibacteraeota bacterium]|nr:deoxyribose-phosphate aldolase [Candidatus Dormibacteraeota bacterium]